MEAMYADKASLGHTTLASWVWLRDRQGMAVAFAPGLDGWFKRTAFYAVTDDFGNLVPVA